MLVFLLVAMASISRGQAFRGPRIGISEVMTGSGVTRRATPGVQNCTRKWFDQTIDHFNWAAPPNGKTTFKQRYFVCDQYWQTPGPMSKPNTPAPIFFYTGNEANVELYVNHTGLMWETAPDFGALLIFAEHRYYGESQVFPGAEEGSMMDWLTSEQALADFAQLIKHVKAEMQATDSAVIGFGGSYGGMLAAWLRLKYPASMNGAIAASAPIMSFEGLDPPYDSNSYANTETYDASAAGGSSDACSNNVKQVWPILFGADTDAARQTISKSFKLCNALNNTADTQQLAVWLQSAWDYMAMGNYPYPTDYITNGGGDLPPFPVRVACSHIDGKYADDGSLLSAMRESVGVFYNNSGDLQCFNTAGSVNNETARDGLYWGYQYCTEMVQPFSRNGKSDMFWDQPWDMAGTIAGCQSQWGTTPRPDWPVLNYGGWGIKNGGSNIVFSNGELDPWKGGGVLTNLTDSLVAVVIEEAAHHLDLMFSNPLDPPSVLAARELERNNIAKWVAEAGALR